MSEDNTTITATVEPAAEETKSQPAKPSKKQAAAASAGNTAAATVAPSELDIDQLMAVVNRQGKELEAAKARLQAVAQAEQTVQAAQAESASLKALLTDHQAFVLDQLKATWEKQPKDVLDHFGLKLDDFKDNPLDGFRQLTMVSGLWEKAQKLAQTTQATQRVEGQSGDEDLTVKNYKDDMKRLGRLRAQKGK